MRKYYFGIDIGGTELKFGFFDDSGRLIDTFNHPTPKENIREQLVELIHTSVIGKLDDQEASLNSLMGIGLTIPGPVVNNIITFCSNIDLGYDFDIISAIRNKFQKQSLKVVVGNDADLAAYGEYKYTDNPYIKNVVFVTLGTGVGGGIIIDGKLIDGKTGSAGEIGHIPHDLSNGRKCGCGMIGCVETVAGTKGMIDTAKELIKKERSSMEGRIITPKLIFDEAKEGDLVAIKVVDTVAQAVGQMAATIAVTIDPELFIIGGGISQAGQFLLSKINYHYQQLARFDTKKARFEMARLGNSAGIYGAYYLLLQ